MKSNVVWTAEEFLYQARKLILEEGGFTPKAILFSVGEASLVDPFDISNPAAARKLIRKAIKRCKAEEIVTMFDALGDSLPKTLPRLPSEPRTTIYVGVENRKSNVVMAQEYYSGGKGKALFGRPIKIKAPARGMTGYFQEEKEWIASWGNSINGAATKRRTEMSNKQFTVRQPFIIHGDPLQEATAFPTHTHGLSELGLPEFFIDPLAFGAEGNADLINAAFDYFADGNASALQQILAGQVVKIQAKDLHPKWASEPFTYCFREVSGKFEAVQLAYAPEFAEISGMRFVQIWVDGDDYALTDCYYRGGVRW